MLPSMSFVRGGLSPNHMQHVGYFVWDLPAWGKLQYVTWQLGCSASQAGLFEHLLVIPFFSYQAVLNNSYMCANHFCTNFPTDIF